jgi:hypothetical protein
MLSVISCRMPERGPDILGHHGGQTRLPHGVAQSRHPRCRPAVPLAERELSAADLTYAPWPVEERDDLHSARQDRVPAEDVGDLPRRVDAVLRRDDRGLTADQRLQRRDRGLELPRLDPQQDEVDRADLSRVVGGPHRSDREVPGHARHDQAVPSERREVLAARDEADVVPSRGEAAAEVSADTAGADHCDRESHATHVTS